MRAVLINKINPQLTVGRGPAAHIIIIIIIIAMTMFIVLSS